MKKILTIMILTTLVSACQEKITYVTSIPNYNPELNTHDDYFDEYIEEVEHILQYTSGVRVVRFIDDSELEGLKENVVGICKRAEGVVLLKKSAWDGYSYLVRVALMIHELGHCDFHHEHTTEEPEDECNNTIMHPSLSCAYKALNNLTDEEIRKEIKQ